MFQKTPPAIILALSLFALASCGGDDDDDKVELTQAELQAVVNDYAELVALNYDDVVAKTKAHTDAVNAFVQAPDEAKFKASKDTWLAARDVYGQTEVFRFYDGPIDGVVGDIEGPEGKINAWPLDENYIDYTQDKPQAGIINDTTATLTRELLVEQNEKGGEKNISTGYHAIEFLLWGQDLSADGPGARPFTDYVDGGTAENQDRRRDYLKLVAEQLNDDLSYVQGHWVKDTAGNFRAEFTAEDPKASLAKIINGMGNLSGAELAGERMEVALENRDQEDEHSCFSDNTHRDIITNATGIQNVYLGKYGSFDGKGIDELVEKLDPALNAKLKAQLQESVDLAKAIPVPFDQALTSEDGRAKIEATIDALRAQTQTIAQVATLLGVQINLEE